MGADTSNIMLPFVVYLMALLDTAPELLYVRHFHVGNTYNVRLHVLSSNQPASSGKENQCSMLYSEDTSGSLQFPCWLEIETNSIWRPYRGTITDVLIRACLTLSFLYPCWGLGRQHTLARSMLCWEYQRRHFSRLIDFIHPDNLSFACWYDKKPRGVWRTEAMPPELLVVMRACRMEAAPSHPHR